MSTEMNQPRDFDDALRRWAGRPPATSAIDAAQAIVMRLSAPSSVRQGFSPAGAERRDFGPRISDIGRRPLGLSPAWATLLAAVLVLVAGTASFIRSLPPVTTGLKTGGPTGSEVATGLKTGGPTGTMVPARDADVVLWLDEGTPVYVFLPGDGQAMR